MDDIERASILLGKKSSGYIDKNKSATNSTNVSMITGEAMTDSSDGTVTVNLYGYTISDDDEQYVDIPTTVSVKAGDTVQISLIGADGTAKSMIVTGVIAGGDRMRADIETAKDTSAAADAAAAVAKENAEKANELANSAITNANAANEQAQNAMNSVNTANGKISALQKNVDTMNSDISTAQDAISKNASDITGINQKLSTDYATKGEVSDVKVAVESDIETKANALTASVAETYAAKSDVTKITDDLSNRISINEKGISSSSDEIKTLKSDTANISKDVTAAQDAASAAQKTADTAVSNANAAQTAASNAQTAADNAKTAADKANSDLAKLTDTVTTQGTKINQNSNSISSVASRTTTVENKFTNYYTKTETNSQIKQTADGINSTVSKKVGKDEVISSINQSAEEVKINAKRVAINGTLSVTDAISNAQTAASNAQTAVDNIQVGGRNLLLQSEKTIETKTDGHVAVYMYGISNSATSLKKGDYVTISVQVDIENVVSFQRAGAEIGIGHGDHNRYIGAWTYSSNLTAKNGVYSFHGRINYSTTLDGDISNLNQFIQHGMYIQGSEIKFADGGYIRVSNPKLEIGNRATDWTPAPEDVQSGIDAAQSTANTANSTANATKTHFYNDSSGSHVISQNSNSAGTRADVKTDGMHIVDQDDGKELASFTSSGAAIGKDSEIHTKYSTDGINFYEKNKSYPFTRIYPVSIEKEKYSAASISSSPSDITDAAVMDDGFWHSSGAVSTSAVDGTSTDNNGWARAVLGASTVQSNNSNSASVEVFASNSNPNKGSGGVGGVNNYINMTADDVLINNSSISHIGEIYTQDITYTTKQWTQGSWTATLQLPVGVYVVVSNFDFSSFQQYIYRQAQIQPRSGDAIILPNWCGLYQIGENNSADVTSSVTHIVKITSNNSSIGPYVHTYRENLKVPVKMAAVRIR